MTENLNGRDHLGKLGVDGRIWKNYGVRNWAGFSWLRIGSSGRLFWKGDEISGSINGEEFFDELSDYQILKELVFRLFFFLAEIWDDGCGWDYR